MLTHSASIHEYLDSPPDSNRKRRHYCGHGGDRDTICIASEDGRKVYDRIAAAFHAGKNAIVSFKDAEDITTAFLAGPIAQLYQVFPEEQVESSLRIVDMEEIDAIDLEDAIYWTKEYIKEPERYIAAAKESFGDYFFD